MILIESRIGRLANYNRTFMFRDGTRLECTLHWFVLSLAKAPRMQQSNKGKIRRCCFGFMAQIWLVLVMDFIITAVGCLIQFYQTFPCDSFFLCAQIDSLYCCHQNSSSRDIILFHFDSTADTNIDLMV